MTKIENDDWTSERVEQMRTVPVLTHDTWTPQRVAQWEAMSAADRAREFDARLQAGHRLVTTFPGTDRPTTAVELRERFVKGESGFDCFEASAPVWPLLIGPSGASTPSVQKATTHAPSVKAAPIVPVVHAAPVIAAPPAPAPKPKATINAGEIYARRREAQSGQTTAPTHRPGAAEGADGDREKPATRAASIDVASVYAARRGSQG